MSTNTGGGAGTGSGGGAGSGPRFDWLMAHIDAAMTRMADALIRRDRVAEADERSRMDDLRIAWHLAEGRSVDELDRNGWPAVVR